MIINFIITFIPNTVDMETATTCTTVATELLPSTTVTAKQLETEESRIASTTLDLMLSLASQVRLDH